MNSTASAKTFVDHHHHFHHHPHNSHNTHSHEHDQHAGHNHSNNSNDDSQWLSLLLYKFTFDHREQLLDSYLRAVLRREKFESQYEQFHGRVLREQQDILRRRSLTLEQRMSKYVNHVMTTANQASKITTVQTNVDAATTASSAQSPSSSSSSLLPPIDEGLERELSQQYDRLYSHYSQQYRSQEYDDDVDSGGDFEIGMTVDNKEEEEEEANRMQVVQTKDIRPSDDGDGDALSTSHESNQIIKSSRVSSQQLRRLRRKMMRLQVHFRIVNMNSALYSSLSSSTLDDIGRIIIQGMEPTIAMKNDVLERLKSGAPLTSSEWTNDTIDAVIQQFMRDGIRSDVDSNKQRGATLMNELRKKHRVQFYATLQFVTQHVLLPDILHTFFDKFQRKLQEHRQFMLELLASTRLTKQQKVTVFHNLFQWFMMRVGSQQRELSPLVLRRKLKTLAAQYYEEYVFRQREQHYYQLLLAKSQ